MQNLLIWPVLMTMFVFVVMMVNGEHIPTTLEGPFQPVTRRFDPSLRQGSDDLPMNHPRLAKKVPSIFPEQIALALSTPTSIWVSWVTGDAQIGPKVTPLDPSTVASEVWFGKESGKYNSVQRGAATVYSQLYPFAGLLNYTSGIIHHVKLEGLQPGKTYYYKCGDSSLSAMSEEHVFKTLPLPSPNSYPRRIAVVGDLGLTSNSTTTIDHLIANDPSLLLMVGDLTYANQYLTTGEKGVSCYSCAFPDAPIRETYQPRWDGWGRFMEPLTSRIPMMVIEGNHEIELQAGGITFKSYMERFVVPSQESGSQSSFYYSFDAGGIHFIMLGAYVDYNVTGAQHAWLREDLHKLDRSLTPWLVAAWHAPWYNSYSSHYQEVECMRQEMESLLYNYGVDVVFSGHVHAYERMNRVYNYTLDPCGPVYITIGDGGNIEKVDIDHADDPGKCPSEGANKPEYGGVCHLNFSSGPAKGKFCWNRQPDWSAFRESSFGHGILEVVNSTYALWTWHRNQDIYRENSHGDQIFIVRQPNLCSKTLKDEESVQHLFLSCSVTKDIWRYFGFSMGVNFNLEQGIWDFVGSFEGTGTLFIGEAVLVFLVPVMFLSYMVMTVAGNHIPTTIEGPFRLVTHPSDPSLRQGSDDLPMNHHCVKTDCSGSFYYFMGLLGYWRCPKVTPLDPSTVGSEVWVGKEGGKYDFLQKGLWCPTHGESPRWSLKVTSRRRNHFDILHGMVCCYLTRVGLQE